MAYTEDDGVRLEEEVGDTVNELRNKNKETELACKGKGRTLM